MNNFEMFTFKTVSYQCTIKYSSLEADFILILLWETVEDVYTFLAVAELLLILIWIIVS